MTIFDPDLLQAAGKNIEIEPGMAPGARERAHVNKALYAVGLKKADERFNGMGGMADGENEGGGFRQGTPLESFRGSRGKGNFSWEGMAPLHSFTASTPLYNQGNLSSPRTAFLNSCRF